MDPDPSAVSRPGTARRSSARRAAILAVALEHFTEMSFAATTIEDIRVSSGASNGSIYHQFASKEEMAGALYLHLEALSDYQGGFLGVLELASSTEEGIKDGVRYHLRWVAANPKLASFLLYHRETEVRRVTQGAALAANDRTFTAVAHWLAPRIQAGEIRRLPGDVYYAAWLGAAQEFVRFWLSGAVKTPIEDAAEALAGAAWRSLGAAGDEAAA